MKKISKSDGKAPKIWNVSEEILNLTSKTSRNN